VIDESIQNFMPGRTGSIADIVIDTSGAMFAYFAYLAIIKLLKLRKYPAHA
jgi:VanZ family protein